MRSDHGKMKQPDVFLENEKVCVKHQCWEASKDESSDRLQRAECCPKGLVLVRDRFCAKTLRPL